jgi:hypothetical protein
MVGPGNLVLPEFEAGFGFGWSARKVSLSALGTLFNFDSAQMWAFGPAVRVNFTDSVALSASLMRTLTEFSGLSDRIGDSAGKISFGFRVHPRLWLETGYAGGIEDFDRVTIDRLGEFHAKTVSGTARLDFRSLTTIVGTYEYQRIEAGTEMGRLTFRLIQWF